MARILAKDTSSILPDHFLWELLENSPPKICDKLAIRWAKSTHIVRRPKDLRSSQFFELIEGKFSISPLKGLRFWEFSTDYAALSTQISR
mmetsp:Transcript_12266/g.13418  ORF Transcript_12266/g.13418 Transcript_12266/m.13418 type:complete len:90 (+) Transcript_12266:425-694(+)